MAGYGTRIQETDNFSQLRSGEIALINGDFHQYIQQLLQFTSQEYTWSFYLVDPYLDFEPQVA